MKVYLVRHGETQANADGIVQGWLNTTLNEKGKAQAKLAAKNFKEQIDAVYSSDLLRATQTAHEFRVKHPGLPYFEDARLRERNFGDATGHHSNGYNWEEFWSLSDKTTIPNAETLNEYSARVKSFIDTLKALDYTSVLVVAHGGTINRFQDILTQGEHWHVLHKNGSVTALTL